MRFNVPSKTLYSATSGVSKVINSKNALTILNNFLFALDGNTLTITGSDVENALSANVEVTEAEGFGRVCIDARRLVDLLKEMPQQGLSIDINEDTLEVNISCADGHYSMVGTPGDQYPEYQKEADDMEPMQFSCPAQEIIQGIDNTIFAVGTDDFHPQMMGILLDIKKDKIIFVATDTRKLVKYQDCNSQPGIEAKCILPLKPATILKNVFNRGQDLHVTLTSKSATFASDSFVFNCRFIKGNFPPYDRVIPQNNDYVLRFDRLRFLNAVRRVGVFVDAGYGLEKLRITSDRLYLKANDTSLLTSGNQELDCEYSGPEMVMGFSAPFLIEICNVLSTENMIVNLSDPSRPGVFRPEENAPGTDLLILLMPMSVTEF